MKRMLERMLEWNETKCIYKIHSQEDTGKDAFFSTVTDMWAYSFSKGTPSQMVFKENCEVLQKVIFTEYSCATASDFL